MEPSHTRDREKKKSQLFPRSSFEDTAVGNIKGLRSLEVFVSPELARRRVDSLRDLKTCKKLICILQSGLNTPRLPCFFSFLSHRANSGATMVEQFSIYEAYAHAHML